MKKNLKTTKRKKNRKPSKMLLKQCLLLLTMLEIFVVRSAPLQGSFWKCILSNEESEKTTQPKFIIGQHLDTTVLKGRIEDLVRIN